jgi:hypothetical protein
MTTTYTCYKNKGERAPKGVESVIIDSSVTEIGYCAFLYCRSLASIDIPESVTTIGAFASDGCRSFASIDIPESVTTIGNCCKAEYASTIILHPWTCLLRCCD